MHGLNLVLSSLFYPLIRKCALTWQLLLSCVSIVFSPFLLPHLSESPALFFPLFLSCDNSSSAYPASAHSPVLKTDGSVRGVGTQTLSRAPAFLLQTLERSINSVSSSPCVRLCVDMIIACTSVLVRFSFIAMEAGNDVEMVRYWKIRVMAQNPYSQEPCSSET